MLYRPNTKNRGVDPLTTLLRLTQDTLQELQLILRRPGMIRGAHSDEVLDLDATKSRDGALTECIPDPCRPLVELKCPIPRNPADPKSIEKGRDLPTESPGRLLVKLAHRQTAAKIELQAFRIRPSRDRPRGQVADPHLVRPRPPAPNTHATCPVCRSRNSRIADSEKRSSAPTRTNRSAPRAASRRTVSGLTERTDAT